MIICDSPQAIQQDFPGWKIWQGLTRARKPSDTCWVASLKDREAGVDPTVVARSATELRKALAAQKKQAEGGVLPFDVTTRDL